MSSAQSRLAVVIKQQHFCRQRVSRQSGEPGIWNGLKSNASLAQGVSAVRYQRASELPQRRCPDDECLSNDVAFLAGALLLSAISVDSHRPAQTLRSAMQWRSRRQQRSVRSNVTVISRPAAAAATLTATKANCRLPLPNRSRTKSFTDRECLRSFTHQLQ